MNLNALAGGVVAAVNPTILCEWQASTGYNLQPDLTRTPNYAPAVSVPLQVQALTYTDLMKLGGLNLEGTRRAVYFNGNMEGIDRSQIKGGDLVTMPPTKNFPGPTVWLIAQVLEHWDEGFTKCAMTLQNGS